MTPSKRLFSALSNVLAGVCLSVIVSSTQAADAQFDLRPHWTAGSQVNYTLTKTRTRNGKTTTNRSKVRLQVVEASENGFLLRVEEPLGGGDDTEADLAAVLAKAGIPSTRVTLLEMAPDGKTRRVRNWEELLNEVSKAFQLLSEHLHNRHGSDPKTDQAVAQLKQMYSTEQDIEAAVLRDIGLLFQPLGLTYSADAPIEISAPTEDLEPGLQLQGLIRATLKTLDNDKGLATIQWDQTYQIKAVPGSTGTPAGMAGKAFAGQLPVSGHIVDEFVFNLRSGWPTRLTSTETTVASDGSAETTSRTFTAE